jgi:hypothetical protein
LNITQVDLASNAIRQEKATQGQSSNDPAHFAALYRETAIKLEIASKAFKLPSPNVLVDPRAITRMAEDKAFYDKVMGKIDAFTGDLNITLNYPHITYSLVVEADGDWTETMVNEDLKRLSEEIEENGGGASVFDMLEDPSPLLDTSRDDLPIMLIYDYSVISVDYRKRSH